MYPRRWAILTGILLVTGLAACDGSGSASIGAADTQADGAVIPPTDIVQDTGASTDLSVFPDTSVPDAGEDIATVPDIEELEELPLEASAAFIERRNTYLDACYEDHAPGGGGFYGQVCRVAKGADTYNEPPIDDAIAHIEARRDTSDFRMAAMLRLLYLDQTTGALPEALRQRVRETVLGFKYWLDEPGDDKMCYWTENHQILYHSAELLAGQLLPDAVFTNNGMTGAEHAAHAAPYVHRWLDERARFGFSEWHSNVYFNEDIPALVNLVDFAEEEAIRTKAMMVLDIVAFDLLNNTFKGYFATTHGRTYDSKLLNGLTDSTRDAAWLMLGLGSRGSSGNFSAAFLATSAYVPPPLLEDIAAATTAQHEHRQHDSIDVVDGPAWGIGYEDADDIVFWAGMAALVAPEVINGTTAMLDAHDLWDGFLFGDIPEEYLSLLQNGAGTPTLPALAEQLSTVTRGIALQAVDTYTYRTPDYQLSGAQDFQPGTWGAQTHIWQATLDGDAFVFTTAPSGLEELGLEQDFGGEWIGSWHPRATLYRNVGVIQYRCQGSSALVDDLLTPELVHAFFPRAGFDEIREEDHWVLARKGDAYLALYSEQPTRWSEDNEHEIIVDGAENVWIVELGSLSENGSFDDFTAAITAAAVVVDELVSYDSPSVGLVEVGWDGPMTVDGTTVDLGPYERWDNAFAQTPHGSLNTRIEHEGTILDLDFTTPRRRLLRRP